MSGTKNARNAEFRRFASETRLSHQLGPERSKTAAATLKELESEGLVRTGRAVNDYYIEIVDPEDAPETEPNETSSTQ